MSIHPSRQILPPPPVAGTRWQRPVMGAGMARLAESNLHLAAARYRTVVHHSFTYSRINLPDNAISGSAIDWRAPLSTQTLEIPFQSSPMGRYVGAIIECTAVNTGNASLLMELWTFGAGAVIVDGGCIWSQSNGQLEPLDRGGNYPRSTLTTGTQTTGLNVGAGSATQPRCLYIPDDTTTVSPPNYRGERLMIRLTCVDVNPESIDIFEMFEGVVT